MPILRMPADNTLADTLSNLGSQLAQNFSPKTRAEAYLLQERLKLERFQYEQKVREAQAQQLAIQHFNFLKPQDRDTIRQMIYRGEPMDKVMAMAARLGGGVNDNDPLEKRLADARRMYPDATIDPWGLVVGPNSLKDMYDIKNRLTEGEAESKRKGENTAELAHRQTLLLQQKEPPDPNVDPAGFDRVNAQNRALEQELNPGKEIPGGIVPIGEIGRKAQRDAIAAQEGATKGAQVSAEGFAKESQMRRLQDEANKYAPSDITPEALKARRDVYNLQFGKDPDNKFGIVPNGDPKVADLIAARERGLEYDKAAAEAQAKDDQRKALLQGGAKGAPDPHDISVEANTARQQQFKLENPNKELPNKWGIIPTGSPESNALIARLQKGEDLDKARAAVQADIEGRGYPTNERRIFPKGQGPDFGGGDIRAPADPAIPFARQPRLKTTDAQGNTILGADTAASDRLTAADQEHLQAAYDAGKPAADMMVKLNQIQEFAQALDASGEGQVSNQLRDTFVNTFHVAFTNKQEMYQALDNQLNGLLSSPDMKNEFLRLATNEIAQAKRQSGAAYMPPGVLANIVANRKAVLQQDIERSEDARKALGLAGTSPSEVLTPTQYADREAQRRQIIQQKTDEMRTQLGAIRATPGSAEESFQLTKEPTAAPTAPAPTPAPTPAPGAPAAPAAPAVVPEAAPVTPAPVTPAPAPVPAPAPAPAPVAPAPEPAPIVAPQAAPAARPGPLKLEVYKDDAGRYQLRPQTPPPAAVPEPAGPP